MSGSGLEGLLRRDRVIVFLALVVLTALAWTYVLWLAGNMSAAMPAMADMNMGPAIRPWSATQFLLSFAMWAVMMVGMMTPAATPIILLYARVGRQAQAEGKPFAQAGWFGAGYLIAWCGFGGLASLAQGVLIEAALLTPKLEATSDLFGGVVLILAGLYQWTPLKESCLSQCQDPLGFIMRQGGFKPGARDSLALGLKHGLFCLGCCWAVMTLLFVGGVMNLLWIAGLAIWVLLEKIVPAGRLISRGLGLVLVAAGAIFLFRTLL
jgi:predicted metal-binding membrane protein